MIGDLGYIKREFKPSALYFTSSAFVGILQKFSEPPYLRCDKKKTLHSLQGECKNEMEGKYLEKHLA